MSKFNNIDDAIRNSFDQFEVPFDASQWSLLEKQMDNASGNELTSFDKKVKESVSGHEVTYNPAAWTAVESQLTSSFSYSKWIIAAGIIGFVSLGAWYLFNNSEDVSNSAGHRQTKSEKVAVNTADKNLDTKNVEVSSENKSNTSNVNSENEVSVENQNSTLSTDVNSNVINPKNTDPIEERTEIAVKEIKKEEPQNTNTPIVKKWSIANPQIQGKTEICQGEKLNLESSDVHEKVSLKWMLDGHEIGTDDRIVLENLSAGTHELELIHSSKPEFVYSCIKPEVKKSISIHVKENANADFKFEQQGDAWYPETKFTVLSPERNTKYSWMIDDKILSGEEMVYLFNKKGNYPVSLLAENINGCSFTESKNIEISTDYNLLAPIAFTPNMDGLNDVFIPEALKYLNLPFKLNIYDRQQGLVFQSNRSDFTWDGRNMNSGELCGQGAYLWVVELTNKNGDIEQYTGTITILK